MNAPRRAPERPLLLVGAKETADILGITNQRVSQLYLGGKMPRPLAVLAATPVWDRDVILAYAADRNRTPGRPAKIKSHNSALCGAADWCRCACVNCTPSSKSETSPPSAEKLSTDGNDPSQAPS